MIEILWHGRGGQGAFTAARLLGAAASMAEGVFALAFPSFGPERRGAPMRAFTKIDAAPIGDRSAIVRADYVIYLDDTLLDTSSEAWKSELKPGGCVLVNSVRTYDDEHIIAIDANGLSERVLGRAIPNTVFLGALSALCEKVGEADVKEAIRQYMPAKLHEKNECIVTQARQHVLACSATGRAGEGPVVSRDASAESEGLACQASNANVSRETSCVAKGLGHASDVARELDAAADAVVPADARAADLIAGSAAEPAGTCAAVASDVVRTCAHIPVLRAQFVNAPSLDPAEYARTTCYPAGHLVAKNAGWRNLRPVIDVEACTGCLQCYLYCPDGAVYKGSRAADSPAKPSPVGSPTGDAVENEAAKAAASCCERNSAAPVMIDYDFCKGCGVCAKACRFGAIDMISESDALAADSAACDLPAAQGLRHKQNVSRETFCAHHGPSTTQAYESKVNV